MSVILLFGPNGQVGWELQRSLALHGTVVPMARAEVDLTDAASLRAAIRTRKPNLIVNAAAYTAVDKAESESELAFAINATAPGIMAEEARAAGVPLLHYSSDYAYSGTKEGRYVESDVTNPHSVYARSKVAGDEAVLASGANAVILRTSWVYAARGANFLRTILRLARERDSLRVVADQIGAPTSAELLADVAAHVLERINSRKTDLATSSPGVSGTSTALTIATQGAAGSPFGLFHCTAAGETSWHGYATFIVSEARALGAGLKLTPENIEAITTEQYPTPAARPKNSRLDCSKLERTFGLHLPPWKVHARRALREILT
ncbi:MAG: dTDP-4-dehydrorhamnose reductase [Gammaproteobacteria bacterium]